MIIPEARSWLVTTGNVGGLLGLVQAMADPRGPTSRSRASSQRSGTGCLLRARPNFDSKTRLLEAAKQARVEELKPSDILAKVFSIVTPTPLYATLATNMLWNVEHRQRQMQPTHLPLSAQLQSIPSTCNETGRGGQALVTVTESPGSGRTRSAESET